MNILQKIFTDYYVKIKYTLHPRKTEEDDKLVIETIPAMDFIKLLIRHIPKKHFKQIRYYGLYVRHRECDKKLNRVISIEKRPVILSFHRWRDCILFSFGYDPLSCLRCGKTMLFLELYYNHQRVSLQEMYEKVMSHSRGRRSSA